MTGVLDLLSPSAEIGGIDKILQKNITAVRLSGGFREPGEWGQNHQVEGSRAEKSLGSKEQGN